MMTPETILVGGVSRQEMDTKPSGRKGIVFRQTRGITLLDERSNAVLVVLKPEENAREVAETILWALR